MKFTVKHVAVLALSAMAVTCAVGCTSSSTTDPTPQNVTEEQAAAELATLGNNNAGFNNVSTEAATYTNGVVTITVEGKTNTVSLEDAKKIFSATVDGVTYSFPCTVAEVLDNGWEWSESNMFRVAKMEEGREYKYQFGANSVVLCQGEGDDLGCTQDEIYAHVYNAYNSEVTAWQDCTCLGMAFDPSQEDMSNNLDGMADFQTGIGINVGDSVDKVVELFGVWKYYDSSDDPESDLFAITIEGQDRPVGYVNFYQEDGIITYVNIKVNGHQVDQLD